MTAQHEQNGAKGKTRKPTTATTERIKDAAQMRVEGESWQAIADTYRYATADSARHVLTREHPELWREAYETARRLYLDGVESRAIRRQSELSAQRDNLAVAQAATHSILAHCAKLRAQGINIQAKIEHGGRVSVDFRDLDEESLAAELAALADPAGDEKKDGND